MSLGPGATQGSGTMTTMKIAIYVLLNPALSDFPMPIYVGQTNNPARRFGQHTGPHCHSRLLAWRIRNASEMGVRPLMRVLEWCEPGEAHEREQYWIAYVRSLGWSPANCGPWNAADLEEMAMETLH